MADSTVDSNTDPNRTAAGTLLYASSETRLRATWRALIPLVVAVSVYFVSHLLLESAMGAVAGTSTTGTATVIATVTGLATLTVLIALSAITGIVVAARLDHRYVRSYGFAISSRWVSDFGAGALIGALASVGAVGYHVLRGYSTVSVELTGIGVGGTILAPAVLLVFVLFYLSNTAFEEVVFRAILIPTAAEGLHARTLERTAAVLGAIAVSLPLFGAIHLLGGGFAAVITSAVGGVLFATAYVLTGQLGLPIGVHFGGVAILSVMQSPVSADPELTLPSIVVAEWTTTPSLAVSVELWIVRLVVGVALICLWVRLRYGDVSIADQVVPDDETDSRRPIDS
ncbi:CPBP family intramembrane glutamic endopeptidase [Natronolimnobius baerhuensis]|uniref:CPBP family intramembrane metalloprotease domain-containing protein n=1 Tax=Natronolimnobius baerhuensis TaxID=253108 RepID=A0A202E7K3_9EURY|nr:CPBP family intramembrane glutamic endopeptidase [Natronolimnobius baerhuensis]OVE84242.1 CPBP family intramembrane metalloprotease domain-containing protein [Natronolimnobius baerhuensis]